MLVGTMSAVILGVAAWRPGFLLWNDSVAVPAQDLLPWMWGAGTAPPRSVPQDAIVAVLDEVVPGWLLQRALVVASLVVLGLGVAALLRAESRVAAACAAGLAMWSAYVFERVGMGHWGLLVGVGSMAWVLRSTADARAGVPGAAPRALGWVLLGSLVPTAGLLQLLVVGAVLAWPGPRARPASLVVAGGTLVLQLVWVIPGVLAATAPGDVGTVFGLRSEGMAGPVLTALGTGGIWNGAAMPGSRQGLLSLVAPVLLMAAALVGASTVRRLRPTVVGPLALLALLGVVWAVATAVPALAGGVQAIESLPGGGLLRDAQKWLAPWLVLVSVSAGLGLARLVGIARSSSGRGPAVALALLVPVLLLPDFAFGAWGRMQPVTYPSDWAAVADQLEADSSPGDVVSWPWSAFRAYPWNGDRTVLDPAPRYLPRTVVTDSRMLVSESGRLVVVPSDDPRSAAVGLALSNPDPALELSRLGIGWILVQHGQPGTPGWEPELPAALLAASTVVVRTPTLELLRLADGGKAERRTQPAVLAGWLLWGVCAGTVVLWLGRAGVRAVRRRRPAGSVPGDADPLQ